MRLDAEPLDEPGKVLIHTATRGAGGNLLNYHVELEVPSEGQWQVNVTVDGPEGRGSAAFQLQVARASSMKWLGVGVGAGVAGLLLTWLVWRGRPPASRSANPPVMVGDPLEKVRGAYRVSRDGGYRTT